MGPSDRVGTQTLERGSWIRRAFAQLRIKLTLPYAFLALLLAFFATFLVTQLVVDLLGTLFQDALVEAGKDAADAVVSVEQEQLAVLRQIVYTEGFANAVAEGDKDTINRLATPLAVNAHLDCLEVLDTGSNALLAMHHQPGGGAIDYDFAPGDDYGQWEMVQKVQRGEADLIDDELHDKYADLIETEWGWVFYTAGPVKRQGQVIGVVLVGTYLDEMVGQLKFTLADVTIYQDGMPIATTLVSANLEGLVLDDAFYQDILADQENWSFRRQVDITAEIEGEERTEEYAEVLGAFEARYGRDLGVISASMPLSQITDIRYPTRIRLLIVFGSAVIVTLVVGAVLASGVVRRLQKLAHATERVATGDLETQVDLQGHDEIASLAEGFNSMVEQLREGRMYRDLLGLTASPEVAEQLRRALEGGQVQLDPKSATATVLFCSIRGFAQLAESQPPRHVITLLNEYMRDIVKVTKEQEGVVNKFVGDTALALFGLLPDPHPPEESARRGIAAALALLDHLVGLNQARAGRGEEPLRVSIGVNTGPIVAGMVGSDIRLEYTIVGDAVSTAQRLSELSEQHPQYEVFFSAETHRLLGKELRSQAVHIGEIKVKGRVATVDVYALTGR